MGGLIGKALDALDMPVGMFWQTGWSLVLGFAISSVLQPVVAQDQMRHALRPSAI
jgi:hypothetical protein